MNQDNEKQMETYKKMQKKHNSKLRQVARKFTTFLKNHFPRTIWSRKRDEHKGRKF